MGVIATGVIMAVLYPLIALLLRIVGYTGEVDRDEKDC